MAIKSFTKDPGDDLDYTGTISAWLGTDTISTVTVVSTPGLTIHTVTHDDSSVTFWASGGINGTTYTVTITMTTAGGRTMERTIFIVCVDM